MHHGSHMVFVSRISIRSARDVAAERIPIVPITVPGANPAGAITTTTENMNAIFQAADGSVFAGIDFIACLAATGVTGDVAIGDVPWAGAGEGVPMAAQSSAGVAAIRARAIR